MMMGKGSHRGTEGGIPMTPIDRASYNVPYEDGLRPEEGLFREVAVKEGFKVTRPEWDGSLYHSKRMDFRLYYRGRAICEIDLKDRNPSSYQKPREIANDFVKANPKGLPQIIFGSFNPTTDSLPLLKGVGLVKVRVKYEDDMSLWKTDIGMLLSLIKGALSWGLGLLKALKLLESPVGSLLLVGASVAIHRLSRAYSPMFRRVVGELHNKKLSISERSHRLKAVRIAPFNDNKLGLGVNLLTRIGSPSTYLSKLRSRNCKACLRYSRQPIMFFTSLG
jgi:hypothetical protein